MGTAIEFWKVTRAFDVSVSSSFPYLHIKDKVTSSIHDTNKHDKEAMRYLSYALYPCVIGEREGAAQRFFGLLASSLRVAAPSLSVCYVNDPSAYHSPSRLEHLIHSPSTPSPPLPSPRLLHLHAVLRHPQELVLLGAGIPGGGRLHVRLHPHVPPGARGDTLSAGQARQLLHARMPLRMREP